MPCGDGVGGRERDRDGVGDAVGEDDRRGGVTDPEGVPASDGPGDLEGLAVAGRDATGVAEAVGGREREALGVGRTEEDALAA